jgi:hypothetical protein
MEVGTCIQIWQEAYLRKARLANEFESWRVDCTQDRVAISIRRF